MRKIALVVFVLAAITTIIDRHDLIAQTKQKNKTTTKSLHGIDKQTKHPSVPTGNTTLSKDSLSRLKAVLVVGPIEDATGEAIDRVKAIAGYLRSSGVNVTEFYDPDAKWTAILQASKGAHIFLYSGHGLYRGDKGKPGGFCLSKGEDIPSSSIIKDLKLHKNALILFHTVCLGAGSSAEDDKDIGIQVAIQRVSDYARPFIELGAAGYYANNVSGTIVPFLKEFFNKNNIKQIYEATVPKSNHIETIRKYSYNPKFEISIASSNPKGTTILTTYTNGVKKVAQVPSVKSYEMAFVGIPSFCVLDFFKSKFIAR
jgi:hypothetical protein